MVGGFYDWPNRRFENGSRGFASARSLTKIASSPTCGFELVVFGDLELLVAHKSTASCCQSNACQSSCGKYRSMLQVVTTEISEGRPRTKPPSSNSLPIG